MKLLIVLSVLILFAACSDSPNSPGGTLPIVQNCRIMEDGCNGDSVVITWDTLTVEVDGYGIWYASTDPGDWSQLERLEENIYTHVATKTGYYCVEAIAGLETSEDLSNKANNRADMYLIEDTLVIGESNGIQFQDSHTAVGNATDAGFAQDLYIAKSGDTILFYSGNSDPATYPGGTGATIAPSSNYLAPGPEDSAWKTSAAAQNTFSFFVQLDNDHFAYFSVDTVATDYVVLDSSQYQSIESLRLFNTFLF